MRLRKVTYYHSLPEVGSIANVPSLYLAIFIERATWHYYRGTPNGSAWYEKPGAVELSTRQIENRKAWIADSGQAKAMLLDTM